MANDNPGPGMAEDLPEQTNDGARSVAVDEKPTTLAARQAEGARAERLFSKSIVISGIRCVLAYVILPFATPFIGLAPGVGAGFGLIIGLVAMAANLFSIRRFWRADHRWKVPVTVLHVAVIALLVVLVAQDIAELVG
ncbi:MAG: hypothetical protein OER95_07225 [Acidimicrobiia bacterium]|nr:hypothetical protein [Acidimicrobiia bacterium]